MVKFLRRTWSRYSKLGKRRKKKQVWRKPTGRDNKMREKRRGYPVVVSVGYKKEKKLRGKIENKKVSIIKNIKHLVKAKKDELIILGKIGKKKRIIGKSMIQSKKLNFLSGQKNNKKKARTLLISQSNKQ